MSRRPRGNDKIWFQKKIVYAKRFAYDVVKYTTMKFGLPKECVFVWEGPDNYYRCDDFCSVMSREIIRYTITNRRQYLRYFKMYFAINKLAPFNDVGNSLQTAILDETTKSQGDILDKVEISLSILGDLVLYLYANDMNLYMKQLIDFWFDCYLDDRKKDFEDAGGLTALYDRNKKPKFDHYDDFHDLFISTYCVPCKNTVTSILGVVEVYNRWYGSYAEKNSESFPPLGFKDIKDLVCGGEKVMLQSKPKGYKLASAIKEEVNPEPDETGVKLLENISLGMPEHQKLDAVGGPSGADVPPSQDVPAADPEELQYGKRESTKEKVQMIKASVRPNLGQGLGKFQHQKLYEVDGPSGTVVPPSQDVPAVDPEELQYGKRESTKEEMKMMIRASVRPSLGQGLGKLEHHKLHAVGGPSGAVVPPSQDVPAAKPEELQYDKRLSTKEEMKMMIRANFSPGLAQGFGKLEHRKLYEVGGPLDAVVPPFQYLPKANTEVQPRHGRRQSAGDKMQLREDVVCPSLEENLGELSLDSSKPKTSMKKRAN